MCHGVVGVNICGGKYKKKVPAACSTLMMLHLCGVKHCWVNGSPSECCTAEIKLRRVLSSTFQHQDFLPGQLEALLPVSHGKDVFVQMRTGGGKSLCMYVLPLAIGGEAMGFVISPLVGLIQQQVSLLCMHIEWAPTTQFLHARLDVSPQETGCRLSMGMMYAIFMI